jgi:hypothetical protein
MTTIDISETYDYTTNRFETLNVPIEIPLEDRRLSVATLKNAFLFECSLKYRASDTTGSAAGRLFALMYIYILNRSIFIQFRVDKNGYYREPDSKWTDKKFVVSYRSAGPGLLNFYHYWS